MIHRYFIKISFDGTNYNGWQAQKNSVNTVQRKINEGFSKLLNEKIEAHGCCRTDAGVHAKVLYAHFDSANSSLSLRRGKEGEADWLHKFNAMLPFDISIDGIYSVHENANARFDATTRTYQYFIHRKRNPFLVNRSYYYYSELDIALMNKAAKLLKKHDDFSAFSKVHTQVKTNNCKIYRADWTITSLSTRGGVSSKGLSVRQDSRKSPADSFGEESSGLSEGVLRDLWRGEVVFTIRADRFLRGMVRMIVGTMLLVGKHKITLSDFQKIIESKDCRNAGASVPACGLYLTKVEYPRKVWIM